MQQKIFDLIKMERQRQDKLHPKTDLTPAQWLSVLVGEVAEVAKEINHNTETNEPLKDNFTTELIHVASVAVRMLEIYTKNNITG